MRLTLTVPNRLQYNALMEISREKRTALWPLIISVYRELETIRWFRDD